MNNLSMKYRLCLSSAKMQREQTGTNPGLRASHVRSSPDQAPSHLRQDDDVTVDALLSEARASDHWISRARPTFLYVMYALLMWALPMGIVAAISPATASAMTRGMTEYLSALPEPLYALFGTGYLGYATLRQWGKVRGSDH